MKAKPQRTERGWAGHFICADRCQFRRNTLLELGGERVVVSTVGFLVIEKGGKSRVDKIGWDRYYETMAFRAIWDGVYWDADVSQELGVKQFSISHIKEGSDKEANDMHELNVEWMSKMMQRAYKT